jgi:hypothetical protein
MEIKREIEFTKSNSCADVYTESRVDYPIPDYLGDLRKILYTEASLRPSGRFAGGDELEFSGVVVYSVIYLDADNELCSVEFSSDYDYSVKCSAEKYKDSVSDTKISNYSVRVLGPRRISASASLVGSVRISENDSISISGNAISDSSEPELDTTTVKMRKTFVTETCEREWAEQISSLDGAIADEISLIRPIAEILFDNYESNDEGVTLKGKIRLASILKNGESPLQNVERIVPFEIDLKSDESLIGKRICPSAVVSSLKPSLNPTENGCDIILSAIAEFSAICEENESVSLITDGYLKDAPTVADYSEVKVSTLLSCETVKGSHNAEIDRSELESANLGEIIFLSATPKVEMVEKKCGEIIVLGEIKYSGIASENLESATSYVGVKFSSPFAINVKHSCQNVDKMTVDINVMACGAVASLDANKLYASCNLETVVTMCEDSTRRVLSSLNKTSESTFEPISSRIVVYYPEQGDTLFSVAKRFHTSSLKIASDNGVSDSVFSAENEKRSLSGIKKLLIY